MFARKAKEQERFLGHEENERVALAQRLTVITGIRTLQDWQRETGGRFTQICKTEF